MGIGSGLYMYDVVVKGSRSLSHLLMSFCRAFVEIFCDGWTDGRTDRQTDTR